MGLAERRAIEGFKTGDFAKFVQETNALIGSDVAVEVDWGSIEKHPSCMSFLELKKPHRYFLENTLKALSAVAADDMGKSALKEKLKSINFINNAGDLTFADGKLTVNQSLDGNGVYDHDRIRETLEQGL